MTRLNDYIEPFPGIRDFIFAPPGEGASRTWIFSADENAQSIMNFSFSFLITHGWEIVQNEPSLLAKRAGTDIAVSVLSRDDGSRVVYEIST